MAKKQLIMEKALELFAENGFESTSVQQITEKCRISKGAFYLSFKSKDELIYSITDHFMSAFVADIERTVNRKQPVEDLLYNYFFESFSAFEKYAEYARLFMKEQSITVNTELIKRMEMYQAHLTNLLFSVVDRQFTEKDAAMKADLVFMIQGFVKTYGELFLRDHLPVDIGLVCTALVEKINILSEHTAIPLLSPEFFAFSVHGFVTPTREQIIEILTEKIFEMDDPIIKESLALLKGHLTQQSLSPAILQGLLKNLSENSHTKWIAYLCRQFGAVE
nr:TetR/AcrR family transcriptional regulator [uncultured Bacillus sp.]